MKPSDTHLRQEPAVAGAIPAPVMQAPPVPVPRPSPKLELYSVSVVNVPVQEILFALGRVVPAARQAQEALQGVYAREQRSSGDVRIL